MERTPLDALFEKLRFYWESDGPEETILELSSTSSCLNCRTSLAFRNIFRHTPAQSKALSCPPRH